MKLQHIQRMFADALSGRVLSYDNVPTSKPEPGEKILGPVKNPAIKSLFCLGERITAYAADYSTAHLPEKLEKMGKIDRQKLGDHYSFLWALTSLAAAIQRTMGALIVADYPETGYPDIEFCLRKDWQVAVWKSKGNMPPPLAQLAPLILEALKVLEDNRPCAGDN